MNVAGDSSNNASSSFVTNGKALNYCNLCFLCNFIACPRSCLALSTVPPALSNCRKCMIGTDNWPYAAWNCRARLLRAQGRDKDKPRGSPSPPLHPLMNHP